MRQSAVRHLLQLRVLRLGFFQDGDVGVGVFPKGEEVLVGRFCLRSVASHGVCTSKTEMGECSQREVDNDASVIEKLLELGGCGSTVMGCQICLAANVSRIQSPNLELRRSPQLIGSSGF